MWSAIEDLILYFAFGKSGDWFWTREVQVVHNFHHFLPLGAAALCEPRLLQQSLSISLFLSTSPFIALSSLRSGLLSHHPVGYPGILFGGGGCQQIQLRTEDRENGDLGVVAHPLVRGSGSSCNLVQELSFHIVKIFLIFDTLRLFMRTTNLFVISNVKQLRTGGSFRILLTFCRTSWGCWRPKFSSF